jgi:pimeloyl-ACP methyl ester carboxylesterase
VAGAVQYADSNGAFVAYQVLGDGPRDLIVIMDGFVPIDTMDDEPRVAHSMSRLNAFARLIRFDRRGVGLSDPVSPSAPPTLEQWVEDAIAVLDAVGSVRAVVLAACEMTPVALLLAASHPDRVESAVVINSYARAQVDDDYPHGLPAEEVAEIIASCTDITPADDPDDFVFTAVPSAADDPHFRTWWEETGRRGASPALARALMRVQMECDVRAALPTIQAPTLVVHLDAEPLVPVALGRFVADHVPGATWVEVPGADDFWWPSASADAVLDEIEEFVTGVLQAVPTNRASELGDQRWTELLDRHDLAVRRQLARFRGNEVNTTGDGFVATFDGPARAVGCACAIRDAAQQLGIQVRSGIHTGEIELRGDDIAGMGVHIAARVAAKAEPSDIWVSRTVTDLVIGSGITFSDRGSHTLKGVPGSWALYAVTDA